MTTNVFIIVKEALAWMAAHPGATLSLSLTTEGNLLVVTTADKESNQWTLSAFDMQKSFAPEKGASPDAAANRNPFIAYEPVLPLGMQLAGFFSTPFNLGNLAQVLQDAAHPLTVAVLARAAEDEAKLASGQSIDPWPNLTPREVPAMAWPFSVKG